MSEKKTISFPVSEEVEGPSEAFIDTAKTICGQCSHSCIRVMQITRTEPKKDAKPISAGLFGGAVYEREDYVRMFSRRMKVMCRSPKVVGEGCCPEMIELEEVIHCDAFEKREGPCPATRSE